MDAKARPGGRGGWAAALAMLTGLLAVGEGEAAEAGANAAWYASLPIILTHAHVEPHVDRGRNEQLDWRGSFRNAIAEMDRQGVRAAILMPPPKPWSRRSDEEFIRLLEYARDWPDRFRVAGGGATLNGTIEHTDPAEVDDDDRRSLAERAAAIVRAGGVAFGETTALHFSFFPDHPFEETPPDHPLMLHLADLAAEHDVPLDLHMEAVSADWTVDPAMRERSPANPARVRENISALERLLAHNRQARIIWVHVGMDSTGQRSVALTRRLLEAHPNLYLSISGLQRLTRANWFLKSGQGLNPEWRDLILDFPDRFTIGSDTFFQPDNPWRKMPQKVAMAIQTVRKPFLPPKVARKLAFENAQRIFKLNLIGADEAPLPTAGAATGDAAADDTAGASAAPVGPRGKTARQMIEEADTDGDGRLSAEEFRGPKRGFAKTDADADGHLTAAEFEARWREMQQR